MERLHILYNIDSILKKEPLQYYFDASLYNLIRSSSKNVTVSKKESISTRKSSNLIKPRDKIIFRIPSATTQIQIDLSDEFRNIEK
jgi:hypothetical protein